MQCNGTEYFKQIKSEAKQLTREDLLLHSGFSGAKYLNYLRSEEAAGVRAGRTEPTGRSRTALPEDSKTLISVISPSHRAPGAAPLTVRIPAEVIRLFLGPGSVPHYPRSDRLDLR